MFEFSSIFVDGSDIHGLSNRRLVLLCALSQLKNSNAAQPPKYKL